MVWEGWKRVKVCRSFIEKRFIPDEIVELKDDRIVYHEGNIMITEWDVLHPKAKFSHGVSCYYMDKGWKISKFLNKTKNLFIIIVIL